MFLFKANLFSKEKLRVETKPNAHSAKFIYSLSFWKPCVVRKWWNTWPSTIQAKLSNLENHILLLVQIHIGDTDSNSPLKNDKFDSFSFPGMQHDSEILMKFNNLAGKIWPPFLL